VAGWADPAITKYPRAVAVTWQTSVNQVSEPGRRLLERLAWLAPEPVRQQRLCMLGTAPIDRASRAASRQSLGARSAGMSEDLRFSAEACSLVRVKVRNPATVAVLRDRSVKRNK
jgi:hypothetical protein